MLEPEGDRPWMGRYFWMVVEERRIRRYSSDTGAAYRCISACRRPSGPCCAICFGAPGRLPNCSTGWRHCSWSTANKDRRVAIAMEHALQAILDSLPPRRRRSKLEPLCGVDSRAARARPELPRDRHDSPRALWPACGHAHRSITLCGRVRRSTPPGVLHVGRRRRPCDVRQRRARRHHRSHPTGPRMCGHASRPSSGARRRRPRSRKPSPTTSTSPCS